MIEPEFTCLYIVSNHRHSVAKFYLSIENRGVFYDDYCEICVPETNRDNIYITCPVCDVKVKIRDGPHVYCSECNSCCGSGNSHSFVHKSGTCVACTSPNDGENHSWCKICRKCRPFASLHQHTDTFIKKPWEN